MRVVVVDASTGGGIGRHGFGVAKHLEQVGDHEVHTVVRTPTSIESNYRDLPGEFFEVKTERYGFNLNRIPGLVPLLTCLTLVQALLRVHPQIVYCAEWYPGATISVFLGAVSSHNTASVIHGLEVIYDNEESFYRRLTKLLKQYVFKRSDIVFAVSEFTKSRAERLGIQDIRICYNGVDLSAFEDNDKSQFVGGAVGDEVLDGPVLLTVARLQRYKGHDMVIRSLPEILSEFPDTDYVITGSGDAKAELQTLAVERGVEDSVHFLGYVPESVLPSIYRQSDIFVMPTRITSVGVEGFGIAYLEANACCLPVVGTTEGGASAPITHGYNGYLVDPRAPDEITTAVLKLLHNPELAEEMGQNGRKRVEEQFTWDAVVANIERELQDVVKSNTDTSRR